MFSAGGRGIFKYMPIEDKKLAKPKAQNLIMENRERLSVSGVIEVDSFNSENVVMDTELGLLVVKGDDLRISKLNLENGELVIEGDVLSCEYNDNHDVRGKGLGFLSKMFR